MPSTAGSASTQNARATARLAIAPGISLGIEAVTKRIALLGQSESGKTNALTVVAEELYPLGAPVVAIDVLGNLYGLRSSADGESDGLPIAIFGGEHADVPDVPLVPTAGAALAREIVAAGASAIVDVSEFTDEEAYGFVADFVNELYRYNRKPLHLILDEAHTWAPERPQTPEHFRCRNAVVRVRKLGRNRGIGSTIASQSSAELAKAALGQTDVLFAMRTSAPTDAKPILAWAKNHLDAAQLREISSTLGALRVGEAWVISPGYLRVTKRARFRLRKTYDSSRTPTLGDEVREPRVFAPVDLERIAKAIKGDGAGQLQPVVVPRAITTREVRVEVPALSPADVALLRAAVTEYRAGAADVVDVAARLTVLGNVVDGAMARLEQLLVGLSASQPIKAPVVADEQPAAIASDASSAEPTSPRSTRATRAWETRRASAAARSDSARRAWETRRGNAAPRSATTSSTEIPMKEGMRRMLIAIKRVGRPLTRIELGPLANIARKGTVAAYVRALVGLGYTSESDAGVALTERGSALVAEAPASAPKTPEILELHRPHLKLGQYRILRLLVDLYPKSATRAVIGAQAGITRKNTIAAYVRVLKNRGLIVEKAGGAIAAPVLFVRGRR